MRNEQFGPARDARVAAANLSGRVQILFLDRLGLDCPPHDSWPVSSSGCLVGRGRYSAPCNDAVLFCA